MITNYEQIIVQFLTDDMIFTAKLILASSQSKYSLFFSQQPVLCCSHQVIKPPQGHPTPHLPVRAHLELFGSIVYLVCNSRVFFDKNYYFVVYYASRIFSKLNIFIFDRLSLKYLSLILVNSCYFANLSHSHSVYRSLRI